MARGRDEHAVRPGHGRHLAGVALIVASVLVGLLLVEVALRAMPSLLPETARYRLAQLDARRAGHTRFIVEDDEIGFLYRPRLRETIERAEFRYLLATDHAGFRNLEPWPTEPDVVVIGDSMAAGDGVAAKAAWPFQLAAASGASVVNLAMNGASPPQMARILKRFGLVLHPRLVLMALFLANDYREATAFEAWRAAGQPMPLAEWLYGASPDAGIASWLARALERSHLRVLVHEAVRRMSTDAAGWELTLADGNRVLIAGGPWQQAADLARGDRSGIEPVVEAILEAHAMATAAGARFVLVLLPSKEEIYAELGGLAPPRLAEPLLAALRGHGLTTADLREALRRHARAGEMLYFNSDGHLNADGHRAVAEALRPWVTSWASHAAPTPVAAHR